MPDKSYARFGIALATTFLAVTAVGAQETATVTARA